MADSFTYNGISIDTPLIDVLDSEAVYDDADRNVMYTKTLLRVKGVVRGDTTADPSAGWTGKATNIRQTLMIPQEALTVVFGGQTLFSITGPDDNNGPKPRRCTISEMIGGRFAIIVFEIEVFVQEQCESGTSNIISHTYSVQHQIDASFLTTRMVRGRIRLRSSAGDNPDLLRGLVVPDLPNGFRRDSMNFVVTADGLQLEYEITDKELYRCPPSGMIDCRASFAHQVDKYVWHNHFRIEVTAPKNRAKSELFNQCFIIASTRIDFATEFIESAIIEEDLYENKVRFEVSTLAQDQVADPASMFPSKTKIFSAVPGENLTVNLGPYGSALIAAAMNVMYVPCGGDDPVVKAQQTSGTSDQSGNTNGSDPPNDDSDSASSSSSQLSDNQLEQPYKTFHQTMSYTQDNGLEFIPSAGYKTAGSIYQFYSPFMTVIQQGSASRVGEYPEVPSIVIPDAGYVRRKMVMPSSPELMPDKQTYLYTVSWMFEIIVPFKDSEFAENEGLVDVGTGDGGQLTTYLPSSDIVTFDPRADDSLGATNPIVINSQLE